MSDRSILHRFAPQAGTDTGIHHLAANDEVAENLGSFGWQRALRDRAIMLELRKSDSNILAVSYGYLEQAEFDPSEGITLHVSGRKIRITGRNLNAEVRPTVRLFEGITRHSLPSI